MSDEDEWEEEDDTAEEEWAEDDAEEEAEYEEEDESEEGGYEEYEYEGEEGAEEDVLRYAHGTDADDEDPDFEELDAADLVSESKSEPLDYGNTWAVSLCFWITLTVAGFLYGAVALAPKLSVWMTVRHEFRENSRQLAALEDKVDYLERVCHALDTDPDFLQRMSQANGATIRTSDGSELIPVSGDLLFGYEETATVTNAVAEPTTSVRLARLLGSHRTLRKALLIGASLLTLFAFTFLNDAGAGLVETTGRVFRWGMMLPVRRYIRNEADHSNDED